MQFVTDLVISSWQLNHLLLLCLNPLYQDRHGRTLCQALRKKRILEDIVDAVLNGLLLVNAHAI